MKKVLSLCIALFICQLSIGQDSKVDSLFDEISSMGKQYELLKRESDPKKMLAITYRINSIDSSLRQTEVLGLDSLLYNIHQFSSYLTYYTDFLNNPVTIHDTLKPAVVFQRLNETAKFLFAFDTLKYDTEYIQESYPEENNYFITDNFERPEFLNLNAASSEGNVVLSKMSKMKGWRCCKVRVKVRIRIKTDSPKKIYDRIVHTLEDAVNAVGKIIPAEVKEMGVKFFATALELEGNYIHFLNENGQRVFKVTFKTFVFLRTIQESIDNEILSATMDLSNTVGMDLPPDVEKFIEKMVHANTDILRETMTALDKTMNLGFKVTDMSADALKLFSKYLLLAGTEFPKMVNKPKPNIIPADIYVQLNEAVLQQAINNLFSENIDLDTTRYKGFKMLISGSEHKLKFDEKSGSILLEVGDFNLKGMYLLGGMADLISPSATINIKKAKIQLVPAISKSDTNTLVLHPRLYFLDVNGSMPLFDRLIAWGIEKNFLEDKELPINMDSILTKNFAIKGAAPSDLKLNFGTLSDYALRDNHIVVGINKSSAQGNRLADVKVDKDGLHVTISESILTNLVTESLQNEGIKFPIRNDKLKGSPFDPSYNYLHFKKLNDFRIQDNKFFLDLNTQVHLRRFLGKKPKINFEVNHAAFDVSLKLSTNEKGELMGDLFIVPVAEKFQFTNLNRRLTQKAIKTFNKMQEPVYLTSVNLSGLQNINFESPFKANKKLLNKFQHVTLNSNNGIITIDVY